MSTALSTVEETLAPITSIPPSHDSFDETSSLTSATPPTLPKNIISSIPDTLVQVRKSLEMAPSKTEFKESERAVSLDHPRVVTSKNLGIP
jgi:hypothetical protein